MSILNSSSKSLYKIFKFIFRKASNFSNKSYETIAKKFYDNNFINQPLIIICTPLIISSLYFYGIGRDRYFVRSDVVVRKSNGSNDSQINISSLLGGGNQDALEDSRFLRTYLESPQVLKKLNKKIDFDFVYKKKD